MGIIPGLDSCWLKIGRAETHFNALHDVLVKWHDGKPYSVSRKYDADSGKHSLVANIKGQAPFNELALIAGDCAHNLRCALDHLVYAMAVSFTGKNPPDRVRKLQFPLTSSPAKFAEQKYRIATLSNSHKAFIENMQPYNRPHPPDLPPILSVLEEFDNIDKHRLIHIAYDAYAGGQISFVPPSSGSPVVTWNVKPLEDGKEFVHFFTDPPECEFAYDHETKFCIGVDHIPGPSGRSSSPLDSVVVGMLAEVKRIINAAI